MQHACDIKFVVINIRDTCLSLVKTANILYPRNIPAIRYVCGSRGNNLSCFRDNIRLCMPALRSFPLATIVSCVFIVGAMFSFPGGSIYALMC